MKKFLKFLFIFFLTISSAHAAAFDILVLPSDLLNTKQNYYSFEETSEIFANDIIKNFNSTNSKIHSPNLSEIREKLHKNPQLKQSVEQTLSVYKNSNKIDYDSFKQIGTNFSCKSVLLISSSVVTNKNSLKRNLWEVLEISSQHRTPYPYRLETSIILLDTVNDIIMWSNNYSAKLGNNNNSFTARNFAQANGEFEKIKFYSKNILSPSAAQNIMLRLFPKSIRPLEQKVNSDGGALRFDRTIPDQPPALKPREDFYGEMLYGI